MQIKFQHPGDGILFTGSNVIHRVQQNPNNIRRIILGFQWEPKSKNHTPHPATLCGTTNKGQMAGPAAFLPVLLIAMFAWVAGLWLECHLFGYHATVASFACAYFAAFRMHLCNERRQTYPRKLVHNTTRLGHLVHIIPPIFQMYMVATEVNFG